jgi:hypothetical protein
MQAQEIEEFSWNNSAKTMLLDSLPVAAACQKVFGR